MCKFDTVAFWLQFHNMPLVGMNQECGFKLGSTLGVVADVDVDDGNIGWGSFLRVKVKLDLYNPLARGRTITLQGIKY